MHRTCPSVCSSVCKYYNICSKIQKTL